MLKLNKPNDMVWVSITDKTSGQASEQFMMASSDTEYSGEMMVAIVGRRYKIVLKEHSPATDSRILLERELQVDNKIVLSKSVDLTTLSAVHR